jgi:hypothetical protein
MEKAKRRSITKQERLTANLWRPYGLPKPEGKMRRKKKHVPIILIVAILIAIVIALSITAYKWYWWGYTDGRAEQSYRLTDAQWAFVDFVYAQGYTDIRITRNSVMWTKQENGETVMGGYSRPVTLGSLGPGEAKEIEIPELKP